MDDSQLGQNTLASQVNGGMHKKRLFAIVGIVVLLILMSVGAAFFTTRKSTLTEEELYQHSYSVSNKQELRDLAANADILQRGEKDPDKRGQLIIFESYLYFTFNKNKSYQLLRDVVADSSLSKEYRAFAAELIADRFWLIDPDVADAGAYTFIGEPYNTFVTKDSSTGRLSGIYEGLRKIYEYSLTYTALPISNYRMALASLGKAEVVGLSTKEKTLLVAEAQKSYEAGNAALPAFVTWVTKQGQFTNTIVYANWLKAATLGRLANVQKDQPKRAEAEAQFKAAIVLAGSRNNPYWRIQLGWANFQYALFLNEAYGSKRAADISTALDAVLSTEGLGDYFLVLAKPRDTDPVAQDTVKGIRQLANMNEKFAAYLRDLGWTL